MDLVLHWAWLILLGWAGVLLGLATVYVVLHKVGHWLVRRWPHLGSYYYVAVPPARGARAMITIKLVTHRLPISAGGTTYTWTVTWADANGTLRSRSGFTTYEDAVEFADLLGAAP